MFIITKKMRVSLFIGLNFNFFKIWYRSIHGIFNVF
jgi:hypothetical protein